MKITLKITRSLNGVIKNNSFVKRKITEISNLEEAIWIGSKRYIH